jgi:hypothetical protein
VPSSCVAPAFKPLLSPQLHLFRHPANALSLRLIFESLKVYRSRVISAKRLPSLRSALDRSWSPTDGYRAWPGRGLFAGAELSQSALHNVVSVCARY